MVWIVSVLLAAGLAVGREVEVEIRPVTLRCEYRVDPMGIDVPVPRLSWVLESQERGEKQTAYRVLVASSLQILSRDEGNLWDSGRVDSNRQTHIEYAGIPLRSRMRCWWKVRVWDKDGKPSMWSEPASWSMGLLDRTDWSALWVGIPRPALAGEEVGEPTGSRPAQPVAMLGRSFEAGGGVTSATLYVTARGVYEVYLNGRKVGDHILAPEWTEYDRRIQYQTYDVTPFILQAENAIGVLLGEGWYAGRLGWQNWSDVYGEYPRLLLQLEVELEDGRVVRVVSDDMWRGTLGGPIRSSGIYDGETIDARRRIPEWDEPGFDYRVWSPVVTEPMDGIPLVWQRSEPIGVFQEIEPVSLTEPSPGVYVFDLGQNMVGRCRLRLRGAEGDTVTVRHAEILEAGGGIYTANLRGAKATETYILSGAGEDVFEPHFTYHGFRYVEVTGCPEPPRLEDLTGHPFCTLAPEVSRFECSSDLVNRLMENILWGLRGNLHGVPTDCPQRDERLGWTGDILAFSQTAIFTMDMAALFTKFCQDLRDGQLPDGRFPNFAPRGPARNSEGTTGVPAWGDAGVVIPWRMYVNYGDRRLLEEHYGAAKKWIDWIGAHNPDYLWVNNRGNNYGDWVNGDTVRLEGYPSEGNQVPKDVFSTAFWANSTWLLSLMGTAINRHEEARDYAVMYSRIMDAFGDAYVEPDGTVLGDTQAGYALALDMSLLDRRYTAAALQKLKDALERYNNHISAGIHSAYRLMRVLSLNGEHEEACRLIQLTSPPSWGYMIEQGATTMWERWDGYVEGRGFHDPGMNSFNHYMFGSVGEWIWRFLVGLYPDGVYPGYERFLINPMPGPGFDRVKGEYRSIRGTIAVDWRLEEGVFHLDLTVPPNSTADVYLPPTVEPESVTESGNPIAEVEDVRIERIVPGEIVRPGERTSRYQIEVPSGSYHFSLRIAGPPSHILEPVATPGERL